MAQPKGINQEFVTHEPVPFPELNVCRYLVGFSSSRLEKYNVSKALARVLHWRLEVNYSPGFIPEPEARAMLEETKEEYLRLKKVLNLHTFFELIRFFLPSYQVIEHPVRAIVYEKQTNNYQDKEVPENWLITYVEDLYLYNAICHRIRTPDDSVVALVIPFPTREEYETQYTQMRQLLPIIRSYLVMDGNHDPIARIEPGQKYWGAYKLKSSYLMNSEEQPCIDRPNYNQQNCVQECFGESVHYSPNCEHCQSVFMHVNFTESGAVDICDPWQWFQCNSTDNALAQGSFVVNCVDRCIQGCHDMSFEYTVTSVAEDSVLSQRVGWREDFFEISENRSIFILSPSRRPNTHIRIRQYPIVDLASVLTLAHALVYWGRQVVEVLSCSGRRTSRVPQEDSTASAPLATFA